MMKPEYLIYGILVLTIAGMIFISGCIHKEGPAEAPTTTQPSETQSIPLAAENIFVDHSNYIGRKFRFQGCFEPHKCSMAAEECDINNLGMCCDCIKNYGKCLIMDLQSVPKERLIEVRGTNKTRYHVEVVGTLISSSRMRPVVINATGLTILGDCLNPEIIIIGGIRGDEDDPGPIGDECRMRLEGYINGIEFENRGFTGCRLIESKVGGLECEEYGFPASPQGCAVCKLECE